MRLLRLYAGIFKGDLNEQVQSRIESVKTMSEKIIHNRIKCNECGDIIESFTRHDFKYCSCGKCAVDGGKDYLRRCFAYDGVFEELSIIIYKGRTI